MTDIKPEGQKKNGRPTLYTEKLGDEICLEVATNAVGLSTLVKQNPHWPCRKIIHEWRLKFKSFGDKYAKAKQEQIETITDEILEISDDTSRDTLHRQDHDGNDIEVCNTEWVNRSRLRIDSRKWLAGKLMPKVYGDKIQTENKLDVESMSKDELAALIEKLPTEAKLKLVDAVIDHVKTKKAKKNAK